VYVNNVLRVRPQVADGGDGLQIWRTAANVSYKQSRTADKGWSPGLGVGRGAKTRKKSFCYEMLHRASDLDDMMVARNAYRILEGKPEGKRPLGRPRRRWEDEY
jgi:hypothetical protein